MSRKDRIQQAVQQQSAMEPVVPRDSSGKEIKPYRFCPICWSGRGGYGTSFSTHGSVTYYKCDKSHAPGGFPCGHTWTVHLETEVIVSKNRYIDMKTPAVTDITTR